MQELAVSPDPVESVSDPKLPLDKVGRAGFLAPVRFKLDPEYVTGGIGLAVLGAFLIVGVLWVLPSELSFWRHPYYDGWPTMHSKFLLGLAGLLVWGVSRIFRRRRNDE